MTTKPLYRCDDTTMSRAEWLREKGIDASKLEKDEHGEYFPRDLHIEGDPVPEKVYLPASIQIA